MQVAGVDGGGTSSTLVLLDAATGARLATVEGPSTNHYLVTLDGAVDAIIDMVRRASATEPLAGLGLSLSGIENEEIKGVMERRLRERAPGLAERYHLCSDVLGSVATASRVGGVCVIAGTGSNCVAVSADGTQRTCGGWGHVLGDHASGYDTAIRAIRTIFAVTEGMYEPDEAPPDVSMLRAEMMAYFGLSTLREMLERAYTRFDKAHIAGFTVRIAEGASRGDAFCRVVLHETGRQLGRHVRAVLPALSAELLADPRGLPVVCVGSVWLAFEHLRDGFLEVLRTTAARLPHGLRLLRLTTTAALGAAVLVYPALPMDHAANVEEFFACVL